MWNVTTPTESTNQHKQKFFWSPLKIKTKHLQKKIAMLYSIKNQKNLLCEQLTLKVGLLVRQEGHWVL